MGGASDRVVNSEKRQGGRFLLTGGSGLLGRAIADGIESAGGRVVQAIRSPLRELQDQGRLGAGRAMVMWDPWAARPFEDTAALEGLDAVVHLSGANVAGRRWSASYKQEIVSSRTVTTDALARTLAGLARPPGVFVTASATGIYGDRGDEILTEASSPGAGFLSETCIAWEAAAHRAVEKGIRVVHLRLGVVLTPGGGALARMLPLFRAGLGGRLGSGRQWMSWVTLEDVVAAVLFIVNGGSTLVREGVTGDGAGRAEFTGPVNCVAPHPVTNAEYTQLLGAMLHRPAFMTAPAFALRLAMGQMADEALLASCRALPARLAESGFRFRYPELGPTLSHLLSS